MTHPIGLAGPTRQLQIIRGAEIEQEQFISQTRDFDWAYATRFPSMSESARQFWHVFDKEYVKDYQGLLMQSSPYYPISYYYTKEDRTCPGFEIGPGSFMKYLFCPVKDIEVDGDGRVFITVITPDLLNSEGYEVKSHSVFNSELQRIELHDYLYAHPSQCVWPKANEELEEMCGRDFVPGKYAVKDSNIGLCLLDYDSAGTHSATIESLYKVNGVPYYFETNLNIAIPIHSVL